MQYLVLSKNMFDVCSGVDVCVWDTPPLQAKLCTFTCPYVRGHGDLYVWIAW